MTYYFLIITIGFVIGITFLPFGFWNYTPIVYILFGPLFLGLYSYRTGMKLSQYVLDNYPDMMKKYSLDFGVMKGEKLNLFNVYHNRNEFIDKNDPKLTRLIQLNLRSGGLLIFSFISLITISIIGMNLKY